MVVGYIDVGGGMRAVYGAGVLDRLFDDGVSFPYYLGVSAGSANIISHLGGHRERTLRFYRDYSFHKEYMGFDRWIKNGSYLNLDYIYSTLTDENGLDPLDYEKFSNSNTRFYAVTTDAQSAQPCYLGRDFIEKNDCFAIKASCSIPLFCPPRSRGGKSYFDGGVSDPIPVRKAFEAGCDKVIITLTLPSDFRKKHKFPKWMYPLVFKKYPLVAKAMYDMIDKYNEDLEYAKSLEEQGKVLILAPDDCCGITTVGRTKEGLQRLYDKGYCDGARVKEIMLSWEKTSE